MFIKRIPSAAQNTSPSVIEAIFIALAAFHVVLDTEDTPVDTDDKEDIDLTFPQMSWLKKSSKK